jgi:hypothetical protein
MKPRLAALALAVAFLAMPALHAAASESCAPCCAEMASEVSDDPCHPAPPSCDGFEAGTSGGLCCEAAPAAPVRDATRSVDAPSTPLFAVATTTTATPGHRPETPPDEADLAILASPLRLSVVLLI